MELPDIVRVETDSERNDRALRIQPSIYPYLTSYLFQVYVPRARYRVNLRVWIEDEHYPEHRWSMAFDMRLILESVSSSQISDRNESCKSALGL
jgi:hypothetical protein